MDEQQLNSNELERQVERGSLFLHSALSKHSARINEIESFLYSVIDMLAQKGIAPPVELTKVVEKVRQEMIDKGEMSNPGLALRVDAEDDSTFIPFNCNERIPICKAVCCKLIFALSAEEIESGKIRWDLGMPYTIRQGKSCYCSHINPEDKQCTIYEHRPSVCKKYSCANDKRIWNDFEKMELNNQWIDENIKESKLHFIRAPMFTDEQTENTYHPNQ